MKKSILIIEDSKALNQIISTVLKTEFDVFSATSCAEAFSHLRSVDFTDLILINVANDQSDNFRFLAHLSSSSLFCDIPTVVLSSSADQSLKNKINALGASFFLSTPFDPLILSDKVKELVFEKENGLIYK